MKFNYVLTNKYQRISEQEAVYFLKQIMNGFRELHKCQVMHRDFKPANIFLHEDLIKIGDFGFSKMGATVAQTNLGTPITMSPELLNAADNQIYNDKTDLWSIGVVFYMMLYGIKGPFKYKNYEDLQTAVLEQSGKNLHFDPKVQVSSECKELLRSLIEKQPSLRISWDEFFNHK